MRLFRRTLKVGAKFGVVIVLDGKEQVEVATFRSESDYADGRHPQHVSFSSAKEDAKRRDFTVNGMFFDPLEKETIDYVNGRRDLDKRVIRTIGKADERFAEDYLRMLRAVRFSTQLNFDIEPRTYNAIRKTASKINNISGERIAMELEGILIDPNRSAGVKLLMDSNLAQHIFTDFERPEAETAVKVLGKLPVKIGFALALAGLFVGRDSDFGLSQCKKLKLSRNQMRHIKFLLNNRDVLLDSDMSLAKLRKLAAEPYFGDLYQLQRAIQKAKGSDTKALSKIKRRVSELGDIELMPKPLLNGHDLMRLGVEAGPALGQMAEQMYIEQLEGRIKTAQQARQWILNNLGKTKK
jgi:poly(A) polymerase